MKRKKPAVLTKGFRLTVPADVRKAKGWKPGQVFELVPRGSGVLLVPVAPCEQPSCKSVRNDGE